MKQKKNAEWNAESASGLTGESIRLPDSLSEENIVALVTGKKQKANKRKVARRIVLGTLAACLALFCVTAYDYAVFQPKNISVPKDGSLAYAENEEQLVDLINDYVKFRKADDVRNTIRNFRLIGMNTKAKDSMDYVVYEEAATDMPVETGEVFLYNADMYSDGFPADGGALFESNGTAAPADSKAVTTSAAPAHSDTNTRTEGVAEADIVKTDGNYIYITSFQNTVHILQPQADNTVTETAVITPAKDTGGLNNIYISDLYIVGDVLIVNLNNYSFWQENGSMKDTCGALIYDITDRSAPKYVRAVLQDGYYLSSRVVNGSLILLSEYNLDIWTGRTFDAETALPGTYNGAGAEKKTIPAEDIAILNAAEPESYIVLQKFPLTDLSAEPETVALFGCGSETYCTPSTLYITSTRYGGFGEIYTLFDGPFNPSSSTTVLSFDITGEKPVFKAKGEIEGWLLNSFSLDESQDYLRVAATRSGDNVLYVLDSSLTKVSELGGFGENEQIKSVRFLGNTAYVVTFRQTDPLFVIDLSDPASPVLKGEVKLPGFSSYLHPAGNGYLIGIGVDGTEEGINGNAKISLFDVSDPASPKEADSLVIENAWLDTAYKAFVTVNTDGSFLIPVTKNETKLFYEGDKVYTAYNDQSGAVRVKAENGKLVLLNEYLTDMTDYGASRVCYIESRLFKLTQEPFVAVFAMDTAELLYTASFAGDIPEPVYMYEDSVPMTEAFSAGYDPGAVVEGTTAPPIEVAE